MNNYTEEELLPISALQHLLFCERQCALIHVERLWIENRLTVEGNILHTKAHSGPPETRNGCRTTRGMSLHSFSLGLVGKADVVAFRYPPDFSLENYSISKLIHSTEPSRFREWEITPVEYKRGQPKENSCDRVQICAQAICLEEMLNVSIQQGELYYGKRKRRTPVEFDDDLRNETIKAADDLHKLIDQKITPEATYNQRCLNCSLYSLCIPEAKKTESYFTACLNACLKENIPKSDPFDFVNSEDGEL